MEPFVWVLSLICKRHYLSKGPSSLGHSLTLSPKDEIKQSFVSRTKIKCRTFRTTMKLISWV
jgi:hypothetical protein